MKRLVYFDLETHRFGPGNMAPKPVCMSFTVDHSKADLVTWTSAIDLLERWLRDPSILLCAHRGSYDFACILAHAPKLTSLVFKAYAADRVACTYTREKLQDIADGCMMRSQKKGDGYTRPYSLGEICQRKFGVDLDKSSEGWRTRYGELDGVPIDQWPPEAVKYALEDSFYGRDVYYEQDRRRKLPTEFLEARVDLALRLATNWGVHTDKDRVHALWRDTTNRMGRLQKRLIESGLVGPKSASDAALLQQVDLFGYDPEIQFTKSMKAIRAAIETTWPESLGVIPKTDGGAIQTAKDVLEMCDHAGLQALIEFNSLEKSGSTYIQKLFDGIEHPVHAGYDNLGAQSSRTSCRAPNLQNQPRLPGVRECFITRKGRVFLACDFSSQEMRTLAQTCLNVVGRSKLAEHYQEDPDFDPHQEFADNAEQSRQHAKIGNFGIPGGLGINGLIRYAKGYGQTWDRPFAQKIYDGYFSQWSEMTDYFKHIRSVVGGANSGTMVIPQSGFTRAGVGYTHAANGYFQSLAAHASKEALFAVTWRCYDSTMRSMLLGSRPWGFIHDEVILETPEEALHEASVEVADVMCAAASKWTPDVPVRAEASAMYRWSKNAKPVYENGRLIPWGAA